jgi:hypothetical protein
MSEEHDQPTRDTGDFQGWLEQHRAKIWIWGIGGLALAGVGCMFLVVLLLILGQ